MLRNTRQIAGVGVLLTALAGGGLILSETAHPLRAERLDIEKTGGSAPLDGMTFLTELGPEGKPADVEDKLVFANGMFVSEECDRRCGYPPAPYYIRRVGEKVEFVSESQCLHKDATLVWRGTIEDGTIKGRLSWTADRWYWTIEKEFRFEGTLAETAGPVASNG